MLEVRSKRKGVDVAQASLIRKILEFNIQTLDEHIVTAVILNQPVILANSEGSLTRWKSLQGSAKSFVSQEALYRKSILIAVASRHVLSGIHRSPFRMDPR